MATIKTSPKTTSNRARGFTLFEILIVLGVIAGTMVLLIPQIRRSDNGVKKVTRHLYSLSKDVRNQARLKNRTFRLVFNMDGESHSYWVESAAGAQIPKSLEEVEKEENLPEEERPKEAFQKDEKYTKSEFPLPRRFFIGQVETPARRDPVTEGKAFIYYSPQGLAEPAVVQLTDRQNITWSIVINPLTGHADIVDKAVGLRDLKQ